MPLSTREMVFSTSRPVWKTATVYGGEIHRSTCCIMFRVSTLANAPAGKHQRDMSLGARGCNDVLCQNLLPGRPIMVLSS